jgi:putative ABC transport system permease protein
MTSSAHSPVIPPDWAERLLRATVRDADWRDAVTGDLREEFASLATRHGVAAARRWYCRQAVPLAARFAAGRIVPALTPPRRRLTVAEIERTSSLGSGWSRELRHAWRALWQRPALTASIVCTLALALAANAVVFNLADALYLRPLRFADVDRLIVVASDAIGEKPYLDRESVTPADLRDWRQTITTATGLSAVEWWDPNLSGVDIPEQVAGFRVTPGFFETLGVQPILGRTFADAEGQPGADRAVILSHTFWTRRFNADPALLGRTIRLDGTPYEVVGVMPPRFVLPYGADVWAPLAYTEAQWSDRKSQDLMTFARLAPGRSLAEAQEEWRTVVARQAAEFPETNAKRPVTVLSLTRGLGDDAIGPFLLIWQAAAGLVLLIACANIANLLLARGTERQPEFAVRLALGAGRTRLVLQLLIEGLCLAVLGVALGAVLAALAMQTTEHFLPANVIRFVPGHEYLRLDGMVLAMMAGLGALATVVFSLVPALQASRAARHTGLLQGTRSATASAGRVWMRSLLAGAQVALTLTLLVASVLILGAVHRSVDGLLGFDKRGLITAELTLPEGPYADPIRRRQFVSTVLDRLRATPGVTDVAAMSTLAYGTNPSRRSFLREGAVETSAERPPADLVRTSPAYLTTMRIPLIAGRALAEGDAAEAPLVALVSQVLAERYFSGDDPIGRRFKLAEDGEWITIVGVTGDVVYDWFANRRNPTVYVPLAQDPSLRLALAARTVGPPEGLATAVRQAVATADADQPILTLRSMEQVVTDRVAGVNYFARVLTVMSALALVLALTGMYSLMAFLTARNTKEVGVRVALGATTGQVTWLAASRAARITTAGLVVGTVMAFALGQFMQSALFGLVTPSLVVLAVAVLVLATVTMAAGYLPARRAAGQDPWLALRTE